MTNAVALKANCHKYLNEKYKGHSSSTFNELVSNSLFSQGIMLDANSESQRSQAYQAYFELVDFRTIFVDTLNTLLLDKWAATSETWRLWVNNYSMPNFRPMMITGAGVIPLPELVKESGEFLHKDLYGEQSKAQLVTHGNIVAFERHTIVNDDVSAVTTYVGGIARAYDRLIGNKVYQYLLDNPKSFGNKELFHIDHKNMVTRTTAYEDDLANAIELMNGQAISISDDETEVIQIQPKYVIVSAANAIGISKVVSEYNSAVTEQQRLYVIVEGRLTGANSWFLACDNPFASIALFTLNGRTSPEILTKSQFTRDGLEVKHRMDHDVKPVDYRGLVRVM